MGEPSLVGLECSDDSPEGLLRPPLTPPMASERASERVSQGRGGRGGQWMRRW